MNKKDVIGLASMPLQSPTYPRGPYKFFNRQYLVISYKTDADVIRAHLPEPLATRVNSTQTQNHGSATSFPTAPAHCLNCVPHQLLRV